MVEGCVSDYKRLRHLTKKTVAEKIMAGRESLYKCQCDFTKKSTDQISAYQEVWNVVLFGNGDKSL